jgi:competence protein ComEA
LPHASPPAGSEAVIDQAPNDWRVLEPGDAAPRGAAKPRVPYGRLLLIGAGVVLTGSIGATLWLAESAGSAREVTLEAQASTLATPAREAELVVDVAGAVVRPGVRRLPGGSRVADAIAAAGGFAPSVDAAAASSTLNLAAPIQDGDKILVPQRGRSAQPGAAPASSRTARLDLNTATQAQLEELPGIGPVTAKKIVDARAEAPFRSVDDLTARKLVGPSTFEKIRELVSVGA